MGQFPHNSPARIGWDLGVDDGRFVLGVDGIEIAGSSRRFGVGDGPRVCSDWADEPPTSTICKGPNVGRLETISMLWSLSDRVNRMATRKVILTLATMIMLFLISP